MTPSSKDRQEAPALGNLALVVLAAGRSTRMGGPKALAELAGRPLLEHLLSPPPVRELGDVVVVLGHDAGRLRPVVTRCGYRDVVNSDPDRGRTGSVQAGLRGLRPGIGAVFVQPVDCPIIRPATYRALADAAGRCDVVIPAYLGEHGHPPLVSAQVVRRILAAAPDQPLRDILKAPQLRRNVVEVDDPGVLLNVDRPEDMRGLEKLYGEMTDDE